jgi:lipid II:glycine glycyltransferase (peptidoglycan interpeptide bridge formation enzyme)
MDFIKTSPSFIINDVKQTAATLTPVNAPAAWDEFVAGHAGHLLQSYAWGELKSRFGWQVERWARRDGARMVAGAQVLFRRLLPGLQLAYIPRGPLTPDAAFLQVLCESLRSRGIFLLKLEPDWSQNDARDQILAEAGFHRSTETIQPPATIHIDLTRDLDAILAAMKPKWRYNIRLAEKKGVTVRAGTPADLHAFYELSRITAERDRFGLHAREYYRAAFELLTACDAAQLFIAEYAGQALAMIFVTAFGREAIYLYGASGNAHRNVMPNHALHWAAIQWAKARGAAHYDLWGIPARRGGVTPPLPNSLYQFKQGFGGEVVRYTGAWDYVYTRWQHQVYRAARKIKRGGLG